MLRKSTLTLGRPRIPVVTGSMATQLSAMNSRQAKIARSWVLALGPEGTSCGMSALMKLGGRGTWAHAGCMADSAHSAWKRIKRRGYAIADRLAMASPFAVRSPARLNAEA